MLFPTLQTEQINAEYKVRALKCHPDKNVGDPSALQEFQRLQVFIISISHCHSIIPTKLKSN